MRNRRLAITDFAQVAMSSTLSPYPALQYPETLFQVIDSFSKTNEKYNVVISNNEEQVGYLALAIILDLHECDRS
jgi:hypothetical protein